MSGSDIEHTECSTVANRTMAEAMNIEYAERHSCLSP